MLAQAEKDEQLELSVDMNLRDHQEDGTILEGEERSVGTCYVSTAAFGSVTYSPSNPLHRNYIVIKVDHFKLPLPMRFKMFGFQDQEDGTILEGEERSVGTCYVSTEAFGSVTYSPSNPPRSNTSSSKSDILNYLYLNKKRCRL
ncbi:hypothetical protein [Paenibacillus montaniterrae]|uniref:hypothetical protein n=1 Tax=Paenibacillus montaniterrae TaxID=429341 RepID=UPI001BCDF8E3|nr:hypothetical protein [Paenibacillus montaniterrae]